MSSSRKKSLKIEKEKEKERKPLPLYESYREMVQCHGQKITLYHLKVFAREIRERANIFIPRDNYRYKEGYFKWFDKHWDEVRPICLDSKVWKIAEAEEAQRKKDEAEEAQRKKDEENKLIQSQLANKCTIQTQNTQNLQFPPQSVPIHLIQMQNAVNFSMQSQNTPNMMNQMQNVQNQVFIDNSDNSTLPQNDDTPQNETEGSLFDNETDDILSNEFEYESNWTEISSDINGWYNQEQEYYLLY